MAYVSVSDPENPSTSPIVSVFGCAQNEPTPLGYIGEIDDKDPRISTFFSAIPSPISFISSVS